MARFCHFWKISPAEFWDLESEEYFAMLRFMEKYEKAQQGRGRR